MKTSMLLTLLTFLFHLVSAQKTLKVALTDCKTKEPIPYAHVGIAEKGVGTISNEQGRFALRIPAENMNDTLTISYIGYETKRLLISSIPSSVELCPSNIQLKEVTVKPKKEKTLGRRKGTGNSSFAFQSIGSGGEYASKISNSKSLVIREIGVYVETKCDSLTMRINLYKANKNKIGEPLNTVPFIWRTASKGKAWLNYELPQLIEIEESFFVGIEVLKSSTKEQSCFVMFQGNYQLIKSDNYARNTSQDKWERWDIDVPIRVVVNYD